MAVFSEERFEFGTKAATLERLAPLLTKSRIPNFFSFPVGEWSNSQESILQRVTAELGSGPLIVRSSACSEDGAETALAGAYASVANVNGGNHGEVRRAVEAVIDSYLPGPEESAEPGCAGEVMIQDMVTDVSMSGVLFTQDLNTGAPYYVINYDDESGSTATVTGGQRNRTLYVLRKSWRELSSPRFRKLIEAVKEIERAVRNDCLDIEFALNAANEVSVLQVRRITTQPNWNRGVSLKIYDTLEGLREGLAERYGDNGRFGELGGAVLGNMPDWNPAEMIGTTPRALAFSLYRRLITNRAWRVARKQMGYYGRTGIPLMLSLAGQPYIDVRESFRSFTPAGLDVSIREKLVAAWLSRLRENHHLHDKIEFDIAVTAFTPDFDRRVADQFPRALTQRERDRFAALLRDLTNDLLTGRKAGLEQELERIAELSARHRALAARGGAPHVNMLLEVLEDAVEYGTIPFAILARHAFIATSYLRALESEGVLGAQEVGQFQRDIATVATDLIKDSNEMAHGEMTKAEFLERYGHLRPGTYDILSLRYDQRATDFSAMTDRRMNVGQGSALELSGSGRRAIDNLLGKHGIEVNAERLLEYCRTAIQGRELAKFVFTRNVSDGLEVIAALGERYGLSREELSYVSVEEFIQAFVEPRRRSIESSLREFSERGREAHAVTNAVRLPFLVTRLSDLVIIPLVVEQPNFITRGKTEGLVVPLRGSDSDPSLVDDRVVAIESADPGFDWIFTRPIRGLITKFGGANSHMAIRCAEFGLPAAIGCGEQIFEKVVSGRTVELNCADGRILVG